MTFGLNENRRSLDGKPTFCCGGVGQDAVSYKWFLVLGRAVFPITSFSNKDFAVRGPNLTLLRNELMDADFFCEVESLRGRWRSHKFRVRFGQASSETSLLLEPLDTPATKHVFSGDSFSLACRFSGSRQVEWLHNGWPIITDDNHIVDTKPNKSMLYIQQFKNSLDAGVYQCMVEKHSQRPLHRPFSITPLPNKVVLPSLPFDDYEIITAGEVALKKDNRYAPRILSVKGNNFKVCVKNMTGNDDFEALTAVVVSDLDRGKAGEVTCRITCPALPNCSCPVFEAVTVGLNLFVGVISFNASGVTTEVEVIEFNLICTDQGEEERNSISTSFAVSLVQNENSTFRQPWATKELVRLVTTASLPYEYPNEFLKAVINVTKLYNDLSTVDIALASAIIAEMVEIFEKQENNNDNSFQLAIQLISDIMQVNSSMMEDCESKVAVASLMLRIIDKFAVTIETDAPERNNKTFGSQNLAIGAIEIIKENLRRNLRISFGSTNADPKDAKIEFTAASAKMKPTAISMRLDQIMGNHVAFVMFKDALLFNAIQQNKSLETLSPIFSAHYKQKRESRQELSFWHETYYTPSFCAFWNDRSNAWDSWGCNSSINGGAMTCQCSQSTDIALMLNKEAEEQREKELRKLFYVSSLDLLGFGILLFIIFIYSRYVWHKWTLSNLGQRSATFAIEHSWIIIIQCFILLTNKFDFLTLSVSISHIRTHCLFVGIVTHLSCVSFSFVLVLEGWQVFLCLISKIVFNGLLALNFDSFYGCFSENWKKMAAVLALAISFALIFRFTAYAEFFYSNSTVYSSILNNSFLCLPKPGLPIYLGFVLPLSLCLLANIVILGLLGYALIFRSRCLPQKRKTRYQNKIWGYFAVYFTFNITWIVGLLASKYNTLVLSYMFVILKILHTIIFFIFRCFVREEMKKETMSVFCCRKRDNNEQRIGENGYVRDSSDSSDAEITASEKEDTDEDMIVNELQFLLEENDDN